MKSYFDGITVLGLPDLDIPAGESLGYQHLTQRFKDGLAAMANQVQKLFYIKSWKWEQYVKKCILWMFNYS